MILFQEVQSCASLVIIEGAGICRCLASPTLVIATRVTISHVSFTCLSVETIVDFRNWWSTRVLCFLDNKLRELRCQRRHLRWWRCRQKYRFRMTSLTFLKEPIWLDFSWSSIQHVESAVQYLHQHHTIVCMVITKGRDFLPDVLSSWWLVKLQDEIVEVTAMLPWLFVNVNVKSTLHV